jgi:glycosyltransferase involved in cell wall biosynthesis
MRHQPIETVSVVIPAYNAGRTIQDAICSVRAQTYRPIEIVVVDDASTDDTITRVEEMACPDLFVVRNHTNLGGAATRNRGIELARGELVAFLDADDLWSPRKLESQLAALRKQAHPAFSFTSVIQVNEYGETHVLPARSPAADESLADYILKSGHIVQTSTLLVPRRFLDRCRFNERLRRFQDIDFVLQLEEAQIAPVHVAEPLVEWRNFGNPQRVSANPDPEPLRAFFAAHGHRLTLAQRLGLEMRSFPPAPGLAHRIRWSSRLLLGVLAGALPVANATSLLLKHGLGVRRYAALREYLGVGR